MPGDVELTGDKGVEDANQGGGSLEGVTGSRVTGGSLEGVEREVEIRGRG